MKQSAIELPRLFEQDLVFYLGSLAVFDQVIVQLLDSFLQCHSDIKHDNNDSAVHSICKSIYTENLKMVTPAWHIGALVKSSSCLGADMGGQYSD